MEMNCHSSRIEWANCHAFQFVSGVDGLLLSKVKIDLLVFCSFSCILPFLFHLLFCVETNDVLWSDAPVVRRCYRDRGNASPATVTGKKTRFLRKFGKTQWNPFFRCFCWNVSFITAFAEHLFRFHNLVETWPRYGISCLCLQAVCLPVLDFRSSTE